jgi:hypothetical protein
LFPRESGRDAGASLGKLEKKKSAEGPAPLEPIKRALRKVLNTQLSTAQTRDFPPSVFIAAALKDEDFSRLLHTALIEGFSVEGGTGNVRWSFGKLSDVIRNIMGKAARQYLAHQGHR